MVDVLKRNNVVVRGSGPGTIIFAHGFIGDQMLWRHVSAAFEKEFTVVLFDYVGCGKSDASAYNSNKYSSLEGYAQDVLDIFHALDLTDAIFVGHSISSMIGLIAAIKEPLRFSNLIFVAPSPRYINDVKYYGGFNEPTINGMITKLNHDYTTWAKELAPVVINKPDSPELADEIVEKLLTANQKVILNFARTTFFADYRKDLLKLKTPTLILQCQDDIMVPIEVGDYIHAHLENSTLIQIQAKGHFPQLSAPAEVIKVIKTYLASYMLIPKMVE